MLRKRLLILFALLYAAGAAVSAWSIVVHTEASTKAIEEIFDRRILKNEAAEFLDGFSKEHPFLGTLFASPIHDALKLPSVEDSSQALHAEVPHLFRTVRLQASAAAWWSWLFLSFSCLYVVGVMALERSFTARAVLFALTFVTLVCFVVGVLAPAMIIWTAPSVSIGGGKLEFVLQHEVRGIAAIIRELCTSGHWIIGGFLLLFSIVTPLTKAGLTFFVTASPNRGLNYRIGELLHSIGKWSMADVFVAGVLLALFALKFQEATKSIPCLGLYYFIGYCLLSMTTTELLVHSEAVREKKGERQMGRGMVVGLFAFFLCFVLGTGLYTYGQYPLTPKGNRTESGLPRLLRDGGLVPASRK